MGGDSKDTDAVSITLTSDEALVLFEWLSRLSDTDGIGFEHKAEKRALWNLCCLLESELTEPLRPDYGALLNKARERLSPSDIDIGE